MESDQASNIRFFVRALVVLVTAWGLDISAEQAGAIYLIVDAAMRFPRIRKFLVKILGKGQ